MINIENKIKQHLETISHLLLMKKELRVPDVAFS